MNTRIFFDISTVRDKEIALTSGPFGDGREIERNSSSYYSFLPSEYFPNGSIDSHPWNEYVAQRALQGEPTYKQFFEGTFSKSSTQKPVRRWSDGFLRSDLFKRSEELLDERVSCIDDKTIGIFNSARASLISSVPIIGVDALKYLKVVGVCFNKEIFGVTWTDAPGLSIFNTNSFEDSESAADSLLHESLHSKMVILSRQFSDPFFGDNSQHPRIKVAWHPENSNTNIWTLSRSLDAFHVYSHLTIFWASLVNVFSTQGLSSKLDLAKERFQKAAFRAEFLSRQLRNASINSIDLDRAELVSWLDQHRLPPVGLSEKGASILEKDWVLRSQGPSW